MNNKKGNRYSCLKILNICYYTSFNRKSTEIPVHYNKECLVIASGLGMPIKARMVGAISPRTPL